MRRFTRLSILTALAGLCFTITAPFAGVASASTSNGAGFTRGACMIQIDPSIRPDQRVNGPLTIVDTPNGTIYNTPNGYDGWVGCSF